MKCQKLPTVSTALLPNDNSLSMRHIIFACLGKSVARNVRALSGHEAGD